MKARFAKAMDQLWFALLAPVLVCGGFGLWAWGFCLDYCRRGTTEGRRDAGAPRLRRCMPVALMIVGAVLMLSPLIIFGQTNDTNGTVWLSVTNDAASSVLSATNGVALWAPPDRDHFFNVAPPDLGPLMPLINGLLGKYGWLSQVLMVLGALRVIMKPVMSLWRTHVESTASPEDDAQLATIEHSKAYHVVAYLLDWGGSIKVGPRKDLK